MTKRAALHAVKLEGDRLRNTTLQLRLVSLLLELVQRFGIDSPHGMDERALPPTLQALLHVNSPLTLQTGVHVL